MGLHVEIFHPRLSSGALQCRVLRLSWVLWIVQDLAEGLRVLRFMVGGRWGALDSYLYAASNVPRYLSMMQPEIPQRDRAFGDGWRLEPTSTRFNTELQRCGSETRVVKARRGEKGGRSDAEYFVGLIRTVAIVIYRLRGTYHPTNNCP